MDLTSKKCVPCEGGTPPLAEDKINEFLSQVDSAWVVFENKKIKRKLKFKDFVEAMAFVNKVADLAEEEGHHPDIHIYWNKVNLDLWTHAIGGLSDNDFIIAAKIDKILRS